MTVGPLFHDETSVFGPALIRAYELECREAVYSRIILDSDRADVLGTLNHVRTLDDYPTIDVFGADFIQSCATPMVEAASTWPARPLTTGMSVPSAAPLRMILAQVDASLSETSVEAVRVKLLWLKDKVETGIASIT